MKELPPDFIQELKKTVSGEARFDLTTRLLYSTDASIYQIEPLGVAFPKNIEEISSTVSLAARYGVPVLARGSGSSLAGQAIGPALILDTSRYLTRIIEINAEERTATVEPGVLLSALNRTASKYGLSFGPDPASADRATVGGSIANNASGAHSILYGMSADHVLSADVVLADGSVTTFESISIENAEKKAAGGSKDVEAALYRAALDIRRDYAETIQKNWPRVWRRASGYNLNYLLPWSPAPPPQWPGGAAYPPVEPNHINLAQLIAGSEGTLAVIERITLNLVPKLDQTILGVLTYDSIAEACDAVPELMLESPSAIELIPGDLIELARSVPAYAKQLTFVDGSPAALLVIEYSGQDFSQLKEQVSRLKGRVKVAESKAEQKQVWDVRKMGLGILNSRAGDPKPLAFVEDLSIPIEKLGYFVRQMDRIVNGCGTTANYYAHASSGCLHVRPILSLKDADGVAAMRSIAEQAVDLTLQLGGAISGEHGDGLARSEWMERAYGKGIVDLFRQLKRVADPKNILNPGKIIDAPPMDSHLRYGPAYHAQGWKTVFDYSSQGGLLGAMEMCNGAGVCRKDEGVMCPSFMATQEEMHSTRGRSNLLRAMVSGRFSTQKLAEEKVYEALDLCLACKGCKSECPSAVDVAKLKYEFMNRYYAGHSRRLRDYLFGYIGRLAPLGSPFAPLVNLVLGSAVVRKISQGTVGLAAERKFPTFASYREVRLASRRRQAKQADVLFLTDAFSRYFHPETETASIHALEAVGLQVQVIPLIGAGRTLISKGFLEPAKEHASRLVKAIRELDQHGRLPVVGAEPSEIFTLSDEFLDFFPEDDYVKKLSKRAWMVDELLIRPAEDSRPYLERLFTGGKPGIGKQVLLHGHCYQKSRAPAEDGYPVGMGATIAMLSSAGYQVKTIDSGCCGMAGAFGYEAEHYEISMKVGEMKLFPEIRQAGDEWFVAAAGTSCRSQINDGAGKIAVHPINLVK